MKDLQVRFAYVRVPVEDFNTAARDKLVSAAARIADPSWLSPRATELAEQGDALVAGDKIGAALKAYRRAVATAPYWPEARHNLAVIFAGAAMYREAVDQMEWYLRLAPGAPNATRARTLRDHWTAKLAAKGESQTGASSP